MNRFLKDLEKELKKMKMSSVAIEEILADHKEMIEEAVNEGLTDEELYSKFGNPEVLARDLYQDEKEVKVNMNDYVDKGQYGSIEGYKLLKAFPIMDLKGLFIKLVSEDVKAYPYSGDAIEVHYKNLKDVSKYDVSLENGIFRLTKKSSKSLFSFERSSGEFVVRYPENSKLENYTIEVVSSDCELKGIHTNALKLKSTSGDFELQGVVAGVTEFTTVSGDYELFNLDLSEVKMSAVSGDFEGKDIKISGNAKLNTVSGDFEFLNFSANEVDFGSVSGDLEGKEFYCSKIDLKSVSGDVEIVNSDKSRQIVIGRKKSVSGDITIR